MNEEQIWTLIDEGENAELECKLAEGGIPKDVWFTYSAFANTNGGIILLGVKEDKGIFTPQDVDVASLQKDFWDNVNNPQKISSNILLNHHVEPVKVDGKNILKIVVPRAPREQKPVYFGQNPHMGTYRRNYEGNYRCSEPEVNRMMGERTSESQDSQILRNYALSDLNQTSLKSYRKRFSVLKPDSHWNDLDDVEFLIRISGWRKDREANLEGLTVAGLLMFGEEEAITSRFPHYFLDYREKMSDIPGQRWSNRVTSQDGNWSGNLYDFYFKVIGNLTSDVSVPFLIEGEGFMRQSDTRVHKALREAVLNTLIHANYSADVGIVIERETSFFRFSNPGILRMSIEKAIEGGNSDPRNPDIFKIFFQLGLGERSGYGLESIHKTWKQQHWRKPALEEEFKPERTTLTLLSTSLLPDAVVEFLEFKLNDRFHLLSSDEILILVTAIQEKSVSNVRMQELTSMHSQDVIKLISNLVHEGLLVPQGYGRGMKYALSELFSLDEGAFTEASFDKIKNREPSRNSEDSAGNNNGLTRNNEDSTGNNEDLARNSEDSTGNNEDLARNSEDSTGNNGDLARNSENSTGNNEGLTRNSEDSTGNNEGLTRNSEEQGKKFRGIEIENLYEIAKQAREKSRLKPTKMKKIIISLCEKQYLTLEELAHILMRDKSGIRKYLRELVEENQLGLRYPNTPSIRNQAYKSVGK